ncbi:MULTISPECIES: ACP S-malonyltransferase [unclassified Fusibacter]|uniref:ACP S-malonyltransferase n=1 Tax=unclassified Fusibacter TaxID=2624464 RepID=UPI001013165B|nr:MULTISPECIES: ACP S-malonyltransferase [unclassified Fusibacter]MCK8058076.1 ACP S-malonyltransferase [Fusibacter sp. A2]NPE20658.1 ACP S-malonyltransferase [Fusibacter sp. A1]RXV62864.1 [acyl-carrier-protein] S-malonyltransferase [Fusibacter sp. A1]
MSKIALVFPGQGAQYVGMGQELSERYPEAKKIFDLATSVIGYDMSEMCFSGPEEALKITENTQPTILTASVATYEVLKKAGVKADVFAGLSLGEYSALVAAGALKFEDAVRIVKMRGKYMQEEVPLGIGGMAAILGLDDEAVEEACKRSSSVGIVEPANYNCPKQLVIAGEITAVEKAVEEAKALGAKKAVMLPVSAPFHTSMLKGAGVKLGTELDKYECGNFEVPVVANVDAQYYKGTEEVKHKLVDQVSNPVMWAKSVEQMVADGVTTFIEVGPGNALSKFIKKINKEVRILNVQDVASLEKTIAALDGKE